MTNKIKVALDKEHTSPAYHLGRLLYILESVQELANPNSFMSTKFYQATLSPASTFARLIEGSQRNLQKLRRSKPGIYQIKKENLDEILSRFTTFPSELSPEEKSLFALGFYHQDFADKVTIQKRKEHLKWMEQLKWMADQQRFLNDTVGSFASRVFEEHKEKKQ